MTSQSQSVTLLILTSRADEAAELVTTLRTGGIPARGIYTDQCERLAELASAPEPVELILCCANDPAIDPARVMRAYREIAEDVPLLILTPADAAPPALLAALREGARDLVARRDVERLQLTVARELADRRVRQRLAQTEQQLELCEQRALEQIETTDEAIALVREGVHIYANTAYQRRFGLTAAEEIEGLPLLDLVSPEHHESLRELLRLEDEIGLAEETRRLTLSCLRLDGEAFAADLTIVRTEADGIPCLRLIVRDAMPAAVAPSTSDPDTGLPNRTALTIELTARLDRALYGRSLPFALLYIGINGFSEVTQTVGATRAFEVAAGFGTLLGQIAPADAFVARLADDGFMLLVEGLEPTAARALIVALKRDLRLSVTLPDRDTAEPDCVIGLVLCDSPDPAPGELIDRAYADAFAVKTGDASANPDAPLLGMSHGDTASVRTDAADREIADKIDEALRTDAFKLVYQPIVSLLGDNQENYSVLVRLLDENQYLHEARELVGPAVRTGRIEAIDRWVLDRAIQEVAEQRRNGQKINFFVNLAEHTFLETTLLLWLCDRLREHEARGNWLTFQFQEIHARQHLTRLTKVVDGLKKIKARIALSRYGHDPQPDALLQTLQADFVLFAPDFAQGLSEDQDKQKHLMALANHAREFNVKTVVTGVEDATTLTVLWGAGIDYVQGNFLQRPSATLVVETE